MTDERLRRLERLAADSIEDEASFLLERVRTGVLRPRQLELAAYCGYPAARLALGEAAPPPFILTLPAVRMDGEEAARTHGGWVRTLRALAGRELLARAVAAAARASPYWRREQAAGVPHEQPTFQQSIEALESWASRPCEETLDVCRHHVAGDSWFERAAAKIAVRDEVQLDVNVMALVTCTHLTADGELTDTAAARDAMLAVLLPAALSPGVERV